MHAFQLSYFPVYVISEFQIGCYLAGRTKILAADTKPNYNTKLINLIAINSFNKYEWGSPTYYDSVYY